MTKDEKEKKTLMDKVLSNKLEEKSKTSTGIVELDALLNGGLSVGTMTQIVGEVSTGKTHIALQIANNFCKQDKKVLFIDTKSDVTSSLIMNIGINNYLGKNFYYICETKFSSVEKLLDAFLIEQTIDLIIIDSIAGLTNSGYLDLGSKGIKVDNNNSNYDSRPLSLLVNKIKKLAIDMNICILLTNEFRNKIQTFGKKGTIVKIFGPKKLQYESTNIIQINPIGAKNNYCKLFKSLFSSLQNDNIGKLLEFQVIQSNEIASDTCLPFFLEYGVGLSKLISFIFMVYDSKLVIKTGSYYKLKATDIKQNGMTNFSKEVKEYTKSKKISDKSLINFYRKLIDKKQLD